MEDEEETIAVTDDPAPTRDGDRTAATAFASFDRGLAVYRNVFGAGKDRAYFGGGVGWIARRDYPWMQRFLFRAEWHSALGRSDFVVIEHGA